MAERRTRVQGSRRLGTEGTISWAEHEEVWTAYHERWRNDQSAERIAERGGFGYDEATNLLGRSLSTFRKSSESDTPP